MDMPATTLRTSSARRWISRISTRPRGVPTIETWWESATMPSTTTTPPARTRQRASHYPAQYSVCLSQEVADAIESFCDTYEVARARCSGASSGAASSRPRWCSRRDADFARAKHRDAQGALMMDAARRDHGWIFGSGPAGRTSGERGDDR